jgi:hypothetical protein
MSKHSNLSIEELRSLLKSARAIQITTGSIFAVIILTWVVLGYWRTNVPVFISTVAMGLFLVAATNSSTLALNAELAKRIENEES